jgi:hypothetical protein
LQILSTLDDSPISFANGCHWIEARDSKDGDSKSAHEAMPPLRRHSKADGVHLGVSRQGPGGLIGRAQHKR